MSTTTTPTTATAAVVTLSDDAEARLALLTELRSLHSPSEELMMCFHAWMTVYAASEDALLHACYPDIPRVEVRE